jgi:ankyrin repeat protein
MDNKFTIEDSIKILNGMNISISAQNLVYYSYKGDISVVKHLINSGVDVNSINNEGFYAIIQAALNNHKEIVELLISEGANINKVGSDKYDALTAAAYKGHIDIVDILINSGAAIDGNDGVFSTSNWCGNCWKSC